MTVKAQPRDRHYYAASWPYGVACYTDTGHPIWELHAFASRAVRDEWVERRPTDYRGNSGYRSAVPSSDLDLRRVLRKIERERDVYRYDTESEHLTVVPYATVEEWDEAIEEERNAYSDYMSEVLG